MPTLSSSTVGYNKPWLYIVIYKYIDSSQHLVVRCRVSGRSVLSEVSPCKNETSIQLTLTLHARPNYRRKCGCTSAWHVCDFHQVAQTTHQKRRCPLATAHNCKTKKSDSMRSHVEPTHVITPRCNSCLRGSCSGWQCQIPSSDHRNSSFCSCTPESNHVDVKAWYFRVTWSCRRKERKEARLKQTHLKQRNPRMVNLHNKTSNVDRCQGVALTSRDFRSSRWRLEANRVRQR